MDIIAQSFLVKICTEHYTDEEVEEARLLVSNKVVRLPDSGNGEEKMLGLK